ncbi:MAG TPA: hypothetical protein VK666_13125 [Chryseolinea sp.]|nr:hypothetical protein [Chryseolinea sp.]
MNTRFNGSTVKRTLFIDFNLYADDDPEFKQELIELIIENLEELQQSYQTSIEQTELSFFLKACHKVKTTLVMLDDQELNALVEDLKNGEANGLRISLLKELCSAIIVSLWAVKK